jgi:hypothetical protein
MHTLQRRWGRVKAQLDAAQAPASRVCHDAVELWRLIYRCEPDPWQREVLTQRQDRILINAARQTGKSSVAACLGLFQALYHRPALVLLLSASLRQAQELGKKLFDGYRALGKPVSPEAENRLSLELRNGSRVVCLPSRESTARGYSGVRLLVADEASRIPDDLYHAIRPMLAVSGGHFIAMSTPNGKRGWWYHAVTGEEPWQRVTIRADQCPRISAAFLEEERRALPSWIYAQEYGCEFTDTLTQVFRTEDVEAALSDDVLPFPRRSA